MRFRPSILMVMVLFVLAHGLPICAAEIEEFKIKRQEVFEFDEKPTVKASGYDVHIAFKSKGNCDVTVAIEDAQGNIVRHLVSGVLGANAPAPLEKNSLKQDLVWDSKDDQGAYVKDRASLTVRVSLGLKPQLERTLDWSPQKRVGMDSPILCAAPEGMYVYEGTPIDHIRLFDHSGNYLRTVYPFPSDKLSKATGVATHTFPQDGKTLPLKGGFHQSTLLTSGTNTNIYSYNEGYGVNAMAIHDTKIALLHLKLNRMATDGSTGGMKLEGGKTSVPVWKSLGGEPLPPRSAAFSPDGKYVYHTGYFIATGPYGFTKRWLYGVMRTEYASDADAQPFVGEILKEDGFGTGEKQFRFPSSVATDPQGRLYVSDYMNDRIQVFDADAKLLKTIPANKPAQVSIHQRSGEIYVFSWYLASQFFTSNEEIKKVTPTLTRLASFDNPKVISTCPMTLTGNLGSGNPSENDRGSACRLEVDSWAEQPTIWMIPGQSGGVVMHDNRSFMTTVDNWDATTLKIMVEKNGKLEPIRDFGKDVRESVVRVKPPILWRQRLNVNPKTGKLYVLEGDCAARKGVTSMVEFDPETGKAKIAELPFSCEDICFDQNGLIYLRTDSYIARYDFETGREVPWDYGEETDKLGFAGEGGERFAPIASGLPIPGQRSSPFWHMGGMYVAPNGHLVLPTYNPAKQAERKISGEGNSNIVGRPYTPKLYPGRQTWGEFHIWDKHGKLIIEDAFPGMGHLDGVGLDNQDNIYVMAAARRIIDGKAVDDLKDDVSETLLKVPAAKAKVISTSESIPVPLPKSAYLKRSADLNGQAAENAWVEGANWFYGGLGFSGMSAGWAAGGCSCWNTRFCLDYFSRSIAPETRHFSVAVVDNAGNLILRIGQYGNVDDGKPLIADGGPPAPRSIGGDEVGLFHPCFVATHTDHRIFIADAGNARVASVKLGYHAEEKVALKDFPNEAGK